jgi:hypothetical protein
VTGLNGLHNVPKRSASPDWRIQEYRYKTSPPPTSRASVSWTMGTQRCSSMLGSAVSSSTPKDFQPNSHKGVVARPLICRHARPAPPGRAYAAVRMQRALDSAIGLPSRSTSASWLLAFLMPAEVSRSFTMPFLVRPSTCSMSRSLVQARQEHHVERAFRPNV